MKYSRLIEKGLLVTIAGILLVLTMYTLLSAYVSKEISNKTSSIKLINLAIKIPRYYTINAMKTITFEEHNKLLTNLYNAKENEVFNIEVRSTGGYVMAGKVLINAMKRTKATVHMTVNDYAYSMGAIVLCHADKLTVNADSTIMYHLPRSEQEDGSMKVHTDNTTQSFISFDKIFQPCKKYLTTDQLSRYYKGEDVYINAARMMLINLF
jgi:ATP-dependent protease ClpP protease subunit